jgi:phosphoenolpyruvate-protein kinase (PTS system EI component)
MERGINKMPYYRTTLTINRIPIHSVYSSTRLTVFTFSQPKNLNDLKRLLSTFTEQQLDYDASDWWFRANINVAVQEVNSQESKGLGFYRAEIAWENDNGVPTSTEKYDIHTKHFGEYIP